MNGKRLIIVGIALILIGVFKVVYNVAEIYFWLDHELPGDVVGCEERYFISCESMVNFLGLAENGYSESVADEDSDVISVGATVEDKCRLLIRDWKELQESLLPIEMIIWFLNTLLGLFTLVVAVALIRKFVPMHRIVTFAFIWQIANSFLSLLYSCLAIHGNTTNYTRIWSGIAESRMSLYIINAEYFNEVLFAVLGIFLFGIIYRIIAKMYRSI